MSMAFKYIVLYIFWKNIKNIEVNTILKKLMITFLFLGLFINILSSIPSMGRFIVLTDFIMYALLLLVISNVSLPNFSHNLLKYSSILLILPIFHTLRIGTIYYGHSLFWSNFFGIFFIEDRNPIIYYVKSIF